MLEDSPNLEGGDITSRNDPWVLPVGKFLRKTKINELPQLINILLGDISIVVPNGLPIGIDEPSCVPKVFPTSGTVQLLYLSSLMPSKLF